MNANKREPEASASSPNNYTTWDEVLSSRKCEKNAQKYLPKIVQKYFQKRIDKLNRM